MKDRKLATRYARALLGLLPDPRDAEAVDEFLSSLREAMEGTPGVRGLLLDPAVSRTQRKLLLRDLADSQAMPRQVVAFFSTIVDHNRLAALPAIAETFHEERERAAGVVPVELITATPLDGTMRERARSALETMTGRSVRLTFGADPGLLGGAVTRVGSTVYDGSLRSQLEQLRTAMARE